MGSCHVHQFWLGTNKISMQGRLQAGFHFYDKESMVVGAVFLFIFPLLLCNSHSVATPFASWGLAREALTCRRGAAVMVVPLVEVDAGSLLEGSHILHTEMLSEHVACSWGSMNERT